MTNVFRALLVKLTELQGHVLVECTEEWADVMDQVRAALATPPQEPLSPAAQSVRRNMRQIMYELHQRCRISISATDTLPIILETDEASLQAGIDSLCTAALRALAVRVKGADAIRQDILDIATELEGQP